jgi:signal transduction histidine kinase
VLDLGEVLNRVVEAARRLTNADEGMILLPDESGHQLYLRARVGIDVEVARNFRIKTSDTLAGNVFNAGQPILIGAQGPQKVKTEYFVNSLVYVPILSEGKPIGVLGVNNKTKEDLFDLHHQELMVSLASYATIAIENARAHEDSLQRAKELEILVEASQVINSSISLEKTLPNICEQLMRVMSPSTVVIYEWHRESQQLRLLARRQRAMWRLKNEPTLKLSVLPNLSSAIQKDELYWIYAQNTEKSSPEVEFARSAGANAIMLIPIHSQDQLLGIILAYYIQPPQELPTLDDCTRARHIALETVAGLMNPNAERRTQNSVGLLRNLNRTIGSDWCELAMPTDQPQLLNIQMAVGGGVWLGSPYISIDLRQYPDLADLMTAEAIIHSNTETGKISGAVYSLMKATNSRSVLGLPLIQRGKPTGLVVFTETEHHRIFSERQIDMGRGVVAQAATALENARLVHDLERSLQDLKDAQDRLVIAERLSAMGELAAAVAHQINNPLTTIVVDTELLLLDEPQESRNYTVLAAIAHAGKRAAGVARRLLAIARPHEPDSEPGLLDVVETIKGVVSLVKSHLERSRVQIRTILPSEPLPPVYAVQGQLDDVWLNLILNAHDAMAGWEDARIHVELNYTPGDTNLYVTVRDNGPGIPQEIQSEIFKPFFTTKPVGEGTGLGLHIVRQVIERVNGEILVDSAPGKGTRFVVRLPVENIEL